MLRSCRLFTQGAAEDVVLHHITERFLPLFAMIETHAAEMATIRNFDAMNRTGSGAEIVPNAQRFENAARTPGKRGGAGIESAVSASGGESSTNRTGVNLTRCAERETRAGETAADHHDGASRLSLERDMAGFRRPP